MDVLEGSCFLVTDKGKDFTKKKKKRNMGIITA